uniref:mucin-5AC n=1 Tax=Scatophagus argus TaxID=75038 RepID=UPI001ED844CC|nr:mucin-5AC [Scatophagus argus]
MNNRLVLVVLFVTLSSLSMGTYGQTTTNMTTPDPPTETTNMTMAPTMTMNTGNSSSVAPDTTMAPTMTMNTGNSSSVAPDTTMAPTMTMNTGNSSSVAPDTTMAPTMTMNTGNSSSVAPDTTMAPTMTTAAGNNSSVAPDTTMAPTMTTAPATVATTAPPLTPNTTVETLETDISRAGCGTERLCAAEPSTCDPAIAGSCFFLSAKQQSGQNFEFGLSGESEGYLAASLSVDNTLGDNDQTYVCANNNGLVQFFGALLNNGQLTVTQLNANSVRGRVNGNRIQCTFAATVPGSTTRASTLSLAISTGPFNSTSGTLGPPNTQLRSDPVDLGNPNATVTNQITPNSTVSPTTVAATTANHAITLQQSLMQALLISVGVLGLAMR